jgi:hypothetical protein
VLFLQPGNHSLMQFSGKLDQLASLFWADVTGWCDMGAANRF